MPLGNGNIGAMVYGGINREQIALNEVTLWSGEEYQGRTDNGGREVLNAIQQAFLQGDLEKGNKLISNFQQTKEALARIGTHLPVGDFFIDFSPASGSVTNYRRALDIERSLATVDFDSEGVNYHREMFISNSDKVMVVRLTADKRGSLSFTLSAKQWQPKEPLGKPTVMNDGHEMVLTGQALEKKHSAGTFGVRFESRVHALTEGGEIHADHDILSVEKADAVTLLVSVTTDFRSLDYQAVGGQRIADAAKKSYKELLDNHIADVKPRFDRVSLKLGSGDDPHASKPTDKRIAMFKQGGEDLELMALFFQFGRYLTLAGSREDSRLPMPLQGLWSDGKAADMGWSDDYHLDVNTEQNYWAAEVGNLSECHVPLLEYINQLRLVGHQSASNTYEARGWCAHVTANAWAVSLRPDHSR